MCTRIEVTAWHSRIIASRSAHGTARISDGSWAMESAGGLTSREYGSMPVTSPARHSASLCRPVPRSRKMAMRPSSTMNRPVTGSPFLLSASSGLEPAAAIHVRPARPAPHAERRRAFCGRQAGRRDPLKSCGRSEGRPSHSSGSMAGNTCRRVARNDYGRWQLPVTAVFYLRIEACIIHACETCPGTQLPSARCCLSRLSREEDRTCSLRNLTSRSRQ